MNKRLLGLFILCFIGLVACNSATTETNIVDTYSEMSIKELNNLYKELNELKEGLSKCETISSMKEILSDKETLTNNFSSIEIKADTDIGKSIEEIRISKLYKLFESDYVTLKVFGDAVDGTMVQDLLVQGFKDICIEVIDGILEIIPMEYIETLEQNTTTIAETTTMEETTTIAETLAERENTDFRNACWGDSLETVKKYETSKTLISSGNDPDSLIYEDTLLSYGTYIIYGFKDDKLYEASYGLKEEYTSGAFYIGQFDEIKEALKEIYGEPIEDEILPLTNQSLIDIADKNTALQLGYVAYRTRWETETTNIMIGMASSNYKIDSIVHYQDKNYKEDVSESGL